MSFKLLWQLSVRNILRHKRRNAMLFAAIAVAVAGVSGVNTLIRGMQFDMLDSAVKNLTGHIKIHAPDYRDDPNINKGFPLEQDFAPPVDPAEVMGWAARIRIPAVIMSERETRGVQIVGVDPSSEHISFLGEVPIEGQNLTDSADGRILIGKELAVQLETKIGRRIVIITQGIDGKNREKGYRIVGTYDAEGTGLEKIYVFTGLSSLQDLLDSTDVTEVSIRLNSEPTMLSIKDMLIGAFNDLAVLDWQELEPQAAAMFIFADGAIYIWFVLMMSALTFGLVNTLITSVMERVRELGMVRALGMSKSMVLVQVVVESTIIMAIGVAFGLLGGYLIYLSIADGIDLTSFADGMEMAGMSSIMTPVLQWSDFFLVAYMSLILGVVASIYPAWRAVKVKPLDAMRR
ncbi:MAG: FtsX-like permease family protein [Pseudomonadales bacterium]|nr:FtsX-like permease family protein [Pseudomonadales bacterium]